MSDGLRAARADARHNRARILEAAEAVFAEQGASASTEAVAARAGVAIGTVFRHFPSKPELIAAVVMNLWDRLVGDVEVMVDDGDANALFAFCASVMAVSTEHRAVFERLAETGTRARVADALERLRAPVEQLLARAKSSKAVRADMQVDEVMALLSAVCQEAMTGRWNATLRARALEILFDGMRP